MRHPILSHIRDHVWVWVAGSLVLGLAFNWMGFATPGTLLVMIAGLLIIIKSQGTDVLTIVTTNPVVPDEVISDTAKNNRAASPGKAI